MTNQEWEQFGNEIRRTVQEAVDSRNFERLNQTISNTVNEAANAFAANMKTFGETLGQNSQASGKYQASGQYRASGKYQISENLFDSKATAKAGGVMLSVCGYTFGGVSLLLTLMMLIFAITIRSFWTEFLVGGIFCALSTLIFGIMGVSGTKMLQAKSRFKEYLRELNGREYCNIKELADSVHKSTKFVVKDLEKMIQKRWFRQGHLDQQKTCLIVTNQMYQQYKQIEMQKAIYQKEQQQKEKIKREQEEALGKEVAERRKHLDPEVRKIVEQGNEFVRQIRACNEAIPGEEISAKISRMELIVDRIFIRVEQNPETVDDIRKLMEYYLPTTIKLLKAYEEMDAQPVGGENIQTAKAEIEATLDTLNQAFEKLFDSLFQDTAWDVSSDISVLHTMLAQEGLRGDGLTK